MGFMLLVAALHDIELQAEWLSSEDNALGDALSRQDFLRFADLCEQPDISPSLLCNSSHLRNFRQKLLSSCGMVSLQPREKDTKVLPTTMSRVFSFSS